MSRKHLPIPARAAQHLTSGPIALRVVESTPDHVVMEMGVDYTKVTPPERSYYADYCDVRRARLGYSLFFGKLIAGTDALRTKIEVAFPEDMFIQQLWGTSREFHKALRAVAEKVSLPPTGQVTDTDKVQTFRSNNAFMGMWGEEALIDFYYLSPRDLHFLRMGHPGDVGLEGIVRVVLGTPLLFEFLEKCRPFVEGKQPDIASQPEAGHP